MDGFVTGQTLVLKAFKRATTGTEPGCDLVLYRGMEHRMCFEPRSFDPSGDVIALRKANPLALAELQPVGRLRRFVGVIVRAWQAMANVRVKRATTAGRQARAGENVPRTTSPGLVACRWRSA